MVIVISLWIATLDLYTNASFHFYFYPLTHPFYVFYFTAKNNHASTPAGLWVLSAFLFFVIVEKLIAAVNEEVIIVEQQSDETSIKDVNKEKEMDNNNCITMTSTEKNSFLKECLKNTTEVM